jgi:hypothetical protein
MTDAYASQDRYIATLGCVDEMAFLNQNCSPIGRAFLIEYVEHLTATPHVLRKLMGSPSQVHTIDNLAASLDQLLFMLRGKEEDDYCCKDECCGCGNYECCPQQQTTTEEM